jgi:hypothetical protein
LDDDTGSSWQVNQPVTIDPYQYIWEEPSKDWRAGRAYYNEESRGESKRLDFNPGFATINSITSGKSLHLCSLIKWEKLAQEVTKIN